ncbi:MAG: hypothetical protein EOP59_08535 [Sphingomonadales bacterium]|nr:MAG: hypothetical protein EOP59_08535 [Sphingomonadales bacterium]
MIRRMQANLPNTYVLETAMAYEPDAERKVGALAAAAGKTPEAFIYDHYAAGEGDAFNMTFSANYSDGNLDAIFAQLQQPNVISASGDGGAHVRMICDASLPTFQLAFWARDRARGGTLPVELIVHKLTGQPAALYGLADRGTIEVGKRADLNVIDHARLALKPFHLKHDLPSGAGRILQRSEGYLATLVAGVVTRRDDTDTGARPGRLVRSTQYAVAA